MGREYRVQQALGSTFPSVPRMVGLCTDESVIGAEFYVMHRVAGTILRSRIPDELGLGPRELRALCESFIDNLVALHAIDTSLPEGALPCTCPAGASLSATYLPPDPPPGHGPHRYAFQVFALDTVPRSPDDLAASSTER